MNTKKSIKIKKYQNSDPNGISPSGIPNSAFAPNGQLYSGLSLNYGKGVGANKKPNYFANALTTLSGKIDAGAKALANVVLPGSGALLGGAPTPDTPISGTTSTGPFIGDGLPTNAPATPQNNNMKVVGTDQPQIGTTANPNPGKSGFDFSKVLGGVSPLGMAINGLAEANKFLEGKNQSSIYDNSFYTQQNMYNNDSYQAAGEIDLTQSPNDFLQNVMLPNRAYMDRAQDKASGLLNTVAPIDGTDYYRQVHEENKQRADLQKMYSTNKKRTPIDYNSLRKTREGRQQIFNYVRDIAAEAGDPHAATTAAQMAEESGWLEHLSGKNNAFGVKGKGTTKRTKEYDKNGKEFFINAQFRDYDSLEDSVKDNVNLKLTHPAYKGYVQKGLRALGNYATNPNYMANVSTIERLYNKPRKVQTGGMINNTGYTPGTSTFNNPYNIIPSSDITMKNTPMPVMGIDNLGTKKLMMPGKDYKFPGSHVLEIPQYQTGGQANRQRIGNSNIYFDSNKTWTGQDGQLTASDLATGKHYGITRSSSGTYNFIGSNNKATMATDFSQNDGISHKAKKEDTWEDTWENVKFNIKHLDKAAKVAYDDLVGTFQGKDTKWEYKLKDNFDARRLYRPTQSPIYTANPNDPRIKMYSDSLDRHVQSDRKYKSNIKEKIPMDSGKGYLQESTESYDKNNEVRYWTTKGENKTNELYGYNIYHPNPIQPVLYKPTVPTKPMPKSYTSPRAETKQVNIDPKKEIDKTKVGMYRVREKGVDKYITKSEYEAYLKKGKTSTSKTGQVLDKSRYELKQ